MKNAILIVGRFQPFHKGHAEIVRKAQGSGNVVVVGIIGREGDPLNKRSPFPATFISKTITDQFSNVKVVFLSSGNLVAAQEAIITNHGLIINKVMCGPDRFDSYNQQSKNYDLNIEVIRISEIYNIRGTQVRQAIIDNDEREFKRMMGDQAQMSRYKSFIK